MYTSKKIALDQVEYLKHLRRKNLEIHNDVEVINHLNCISYFRLSAYMHSFYQPNDPEKKFIAGTNFNDVIKLYLFDKNLRLLILNPIESIEIALRTQVASALAKNHGPLGYLNPNIFDSRYNHQKLIELVTRQSHLQNSGIFKKNYTTKNTKSPLQTPIWMVVELLTLKEVSTLFSNLKLSTDTEIMEAHFGWKFPLLKSWFRNVSDLRNLCAHHARVWNREFGSIPETPRKNPLNWPSIPNFISIPTKTGKSQFLNPQRRLYFQLIVIQALIKKILPINNWANNLIHLLERNHHVSISHMGFPNDWESQNFWTSPDVYRSL